MVDVGQGYLDAELTLIVRHSTGSERADLLFGVVELRPREQLHSPALVDGAGQPLRSKLTESTYAYALRKPVSVPEALAFFGATDRSLEFDGKRLQIDARGLRDTSTPELPLLLDEQDPLGNLLPERHGGIRVASKVGEGEARFGDFSSQYSPERLAKFRQWVVDAIHADLIAYSEYFGSLHLLLPNPILRHVNSRNEPDRGCVAVELAIRRGASLEGCSIQLTDHRVAGIGFDRTEHKLKERMLIAVPRDPHELELKLHGPSGLLYRSKGIFLRGISINMELIARSRKVQDPRDPTRSDTVGLIDGDERPMLVGDVSPADSPEHAEGLLAQARARRGLASTSFRLFPSGSRAEAREHLRSLIKSARTQLLFADVFLSARDVLEYATFATSLRLTVRLLGSRSFAAQKVDESGKLQGDLLSERIASIAKQDPALRLECRLVRGKKPDFHDRFLVIDEHVYVLGSSLNEFGERLTTLVRWNDPAAIRAELEARWSTNRSVALADWRATATDEDP